MSKDVTSAINLLHFRPQGHRTSLGYCMKMLNFSELYILELSISLKWVVGCYNIMQQPGEYNITNWLDCLQAGCTSELVVSPITHDGPRPEVGGNTKVTILGVGNVSMACSLSILQSVSPTVHITEWAPKTFDFYSELVYSATPFQQIHFIGANNYYEYWW